ncbi:LysR family transcriptional regulator [Pseudomonas syringae pv. syringae]|uniref:LysR family transcriptional regulator n=1 Tax=Pseudomonas syringae pv. syringae TaxID=321 RepID=A0AB35JTM3_PSESY|nr:LysR family transcriptional regulator [Pseudomonas syringae]MDC3738451.1 LysR family transcriptional regulator [Pseudomonas syringae pv. syringae]
MMRLGDLKLFVRTVKLGSFSNAAREADLLPGQVSAAIKRLEHELGIRLFARSTRSLRLTGEGETYLPSAITALDALAQGQERLHGEGNQLQGILQVAAPSDLGRNVLLSCFSQFRKEHPQLTLRLLISDRLANVFRDPVDIAIRYGSAEDASYVERPLAAWNRRVLVASPAYLSRHGRPAMLEDLSHHSCLLYMLNEHVYDNWKIGQQKIPVKGLLLSDDADVVRLWAIAGEGIAYKSWLDVREDVLSSRLEILLGQHPGELSPLNLVCPHRKQYSPAVRQLHQMLSRHLAPFAADMAAALANAEIPDSTA